MNYSDNMKERLINYILRNLFNAVTIGEIVSNHPKTGAILIEGKELTVSEIKQLQAEIKALEGFRVWTLMSQTTKYLAEDKIFNQSTNMEDIRYGKAMLYNLSLQHSILKAIKNKNL